MQHDIVSHKCKHSIKTTTSCTDYRANFNNGNTHIKQKTIYNFYILLQTKFLHL